MTLQRVKYGVLALCFVLIIVALREFQDYRSRAAFCDHIRDIEQRLPEAAQAEANRDWNLYREDYIRLGISREEATRDTIRAFTEGAQQGLREMQQTRGVDCL